MKKLQQLGVGIRAFFYPMHLQPVLLEQGYFHNLWLPVSEWLAERCFYVPSSLALTSQQITQVAEALHQLFIG